MSSGSAPLQYSFAPPPQGQRAARPAWFTRRPRLPARRTPTLGSLTLSWVLATLSVLALWSVLFVTLMSPLQQAHSQHNAYALFREELTQLSPRTAPLGGAITPDAPVALLNAPAVGLHDVVVVEGTASGDLMRGPGHRRDSPLPGQPGVSVVYGRASLFGGPFADLGRATAGEQITATTGEGVFTYVVEDVRHAGDPYPTTLAQGQGRLTLVSSEGGSWRNGWAPRHMVYLDAALRGQAAAVPPGRPSSVARSEYSMRGDIGALYQLVLWLPLLLGALLAAVWAVGRWGRWQAWLVGAPVVLAALWGSSETAVQLLPNLM